MESGGRLALGLLCVSCHHCAPPSLGLFLISLSPFPPTSKRHTDCLFKLESLIELRLCTGTCV